MKVNIKMVAQIANVSPATVSRVLNAPELVGEQARKRVLAAIEQLNYQPNSVARSLSSQRSRSIGVIVPGIHNLFFIELHKGIHAAAKDAGLDVLLHDSNRGAGTIADGFTTLMQRQIDGLIFSSAYLSSDYDPVLSRLDVPVVLVLTESANREMTALKVDDRRACFDAVAYLVARGHRNIALISGPLDDVVAGQARYDGYLSALRHYQIPVNPALITFGEFRYEDGYAAMSKLLKLPNRPEFTAVFAASDEMALGAMRALHEHGLRVPTDVSVMGYDDVSVANMVTPKLTTVAQPFAEIGSRAVRMLVDLLEERADRPASGVHFLEHRIIERESVTAAPY